MRILTPLWRSLRLCEHLLTGATIALIVAFGHRLGLRTRRLPDLVRRWHGRLCRALGIRIARDAHVVLHLLRGQPRRGSHRDRLEAFYRPQAPDYDAFRERLLHGRRELIERLDPPAGSRLVEFGGGRGATCSSSVIDSPASGRWTRSICARPCWRRHADARPGCRTCPWWRPMQSPSAARSRHDCVYFSYSLTMIPDWRGALENALSLLRRGGLLGVLDFYVSETSPPPGAARHVAVDRFFWPRWFVHDGVRPCPDHLRRLRELLPDHVVEERRASVPYLPGLRVPYHLFVGRRADT